MTEISDTLSQKTALKVWLIKTLEEDTVKVGVPMTDAGIIFVDKIPSAMVIDGDYYRYKTNIKQELEKFAVLVYQREVPAPNIESLR